MAASAATTAKNDTAFTKNTQADADRGDEQSGDRGPVIRAEFPTALVERDGVRPAGPRPTISSTNA